METPVTLRARICTDSFHVVGVFIATSARYPPAQPKARVVGVALPTGVEVATSSVVTDGKGNGVYLLNEKDESSSGAPVMVGYRLDGSSKKVWEVRIPGEQLFLCSSQFMGKCYNVKVLHCFEEIDRP